MSDILFEHRGKLGLVTFNRASALNALTHEMVTALAKQLEDWRHDDTVKAVIVTSTNEKAFSAGGDVRDLWERREDPPFHFFWDEYRLNREIHRYPKPYIPLINGIVMGGGVGVSLNSRCVVAGERIAFAMPEVGIGFFPDVGGSYLLPRMKGKSGTYCALTGARLKQGECFDLGLATHAIHSDHFGAIMERLIEGEAAEPVLAAYHAPVAPTWTGEQQAQIDEWFSHDSLADIVLALANAQGDFAARTLDQIRAKSPTSLHIALEQMLRGVALEFEACMQMEYRIVHRILKEDDFYEGVRAAIIEKDGMPNWSPRDLAAVDPADIKAHFAPLDGAELSFER